MRKLISWTLMLTATAALLAASGCTLGKFVRIKGGKLPDGFVGSVYLSLFPIEVLEPRVINANVSCDLERNSKAPPGLEVDSALCALSGTPTKAGDFTFRVCADENQLMTSDCDTFTITIRPFSITALTPPSVEVNAADFTLTIDGLGFDTSTHILWNGAELPGGPAVTATLVNSQQVKLRLIRSNLLDAPREVQISAAKGNGAFQTNALRFTISPAPTSLVSIAVTPANPSIQAGNTLPFAATGTFSDNSTRDLTASVTWSSSNSAIATVSDTAPTKGLAAGVAPGGPVTITATDTSVTPNVSGSTTLTVTAPIPVLTSIAVTPANPSILVGGTQQFTATGTFSDNSTQNLTNAVMWSASDATNSNVASISNTAPNQGLATGNSPGTATITATDPATNINGTTTLTVVAVPPPPPPGVLARVSIRTDNGQGNAASPAFGNDTSSMAVSRNGRYVVFTSEATNLDPAAPNTVPGLFLRDACRGPGAPASCTRTTTRILVPLAPEPPVGAADVTPDGEWIAFTTSSNVGTEGGVWVRRRSGGTPARLNDLAANLSTKGFDEFWNAPALSDDGRFVAVQTDAALLATDANGSSDIYLFDRDSDGDGIFDEAGDISVKLVSETPAGTTGNGASTLPDISANGRFVVYMTSAKDIVSGLTLTQEVLLRDATITCSNVPGATPCTTRISTDTLGGRALQSASEPRISADARQVVFTATLLGANQPQVFLATCTATAGCNNPSFTLVSVGTDGLSLGNGTSQFPSISADGRFVGFESDATNLTAAGGTAGVSRAFVRDVRDSCPGAATPCSAQTNRVSQLPDGTPSNGVDTHAVVSPDGAFAVFVSSADNLDPPDTNFQQDIFIAVTGFTPSVVLPNPIPPPAGIARTERRHHAPEMAYAPKSAVWRGNPRWPSRPSLANTPARGEK